MHSIQQVLTRLIFAFSFFKPTPQIDEGLKVKYETFVRDAFLNGNTTLESANEYAKSKLQAQYRITNVGKPRVMEYAPEVFYDKYNGGDTSWINKQLKTIITENDKNFKGKNLEANYSLQLIENSLNTGKPSYNIVKTNEYGENVVLLNEQNRPVVFYPKIEEADFYKEYIKQYNTDRKYTKQDILNLLNNNIVDKNNKKYRDWK